MFDLDKARAEFPITEHTVFLNHAAAGPIPRRSQLAMTELIDDYVNYALMHKDAWSARYQRVREQSARLLNARPDQIGFIKNTSEGLSMAANGVDWRPGDNAVVPAADFPTVVYPWTNLAEQGVEARLVAARDGRVLLDDIAAAIDERTRVVAISTVQFASGYRSDLAPIGQLCRERDILFVVDGIQSLGALTLDVQACGIDVVAADAHKWLLGPTGIGIFFVSDRALETLKVRSVGWLSVQQPFEFHYRIDLLPDARRFEPGSENAIGIYGLGGTLDLIDEFGIEAIESRILSLTDQLCEGLDERGYEVVSPREGYERSGIVIFRNSFHDTAGIFERLSAENIAVSVRGGGIRVSPHYYNSEDEIAQLLAALP